MKRRYWQICYTDSTYCDNADKIRYTKYGVWYIDTEEDGKYWQFVPWRRVQSMMTWKA
jgi:hypothetical protein